MEVSNDRAVIHNTLDQKEMQRQSLRKRMLGMAFLSYLVPLALIGLACYHGMVPPKVVFYFAVMVLVSNLIFLLMFQTGFNLWFREPSLTALQMAASILPLLYVMYYVEDGQARATVMLAIVLPLLFGILALSFRQFLVVGAWFLSGYCVLMLKIWWKKPEVMDPTLEFIQLVAFILVLATSSAMGGFIYGLRMKLRDRNAKLKQAVATIEELVSLDSLTGIYNRRHLFKILNQETNRCGRSQNTFCLCIMDIDHFKQVNDTYGHLAGDAVLRQMADNVAGELRSIDCFGRYGGEEFLMVLPQTSLEGALIKAERVRQQIEALEFPKVAGNFRITVSIGVAEHQEGESVDDTLARADQCLYAAKAAGRNQVWSEKQYATRSTAKTGSEKLLSEL
jgi:diguanylate cyclase